MMKLVLEVVEQMRRVVDVMAAAILFCILAGGSVQGAGDRLSLILTGEGTSAEAGLRFLWPASESRPGTELIPLRLVEREEGRGGEVRPGWLVFRELDLLSASGEAAAGSRVLRLEEEPGVFAVETTVLREIPAASGSYSVPHFALPAVRVPPAYHRLLTFKVEEFVTPVHRPVPTSGPVLLFTDRLDVVIISPLDNFMDALTAPAAGEWRMGFGGLIRRIPAGTVHRVLIVSGRGINDTFVKWGKVIQGWHGHRPAGPYSDVAMSRIGYWTDNGSYYYYRTEPGLNYHDTLLAVKRYADQEQIPYGYFQIDSWWYPKVRIPDRSSHYRGGCLRWEPIPELFPKGLSAFSRELGLPLVAHNRFFSDQSDYCRRYQCVYGNDPKKQGALPVDPAFWEEIMDRAVEYGVQVYEQDWLYTQLAMIPWLREGLGNAASWYDAMAGAAEKRGLTMQLCMASPEFFLQQLKHGNETHARVSHDYKGGLAKSFFWVPFHEASLFAHAVGLWPFKDNFQTTTGQRATYMLIPETSPFEEALIAALSGGPVGPSDRIGYSDRCLIMRTCREDGVLLKPDRPATPLDRMWLDNYNMVLGGSRPWTIHTWSDHSIGRVMYLAAFNIWPARMTDPSVRRSELKLRGAYLVYEWRTGQLRELNEHLRFGTMPSNQAFYYVLTPLLQNGFAIIGEPEKFITLSKKRFPEIREDAGGMVLKMEGAAGEKIELLVYSRRGGRALSPAWPSGLALVSGLNRLEVVLDTAGTAALRLE